MGEWAVTDIPGFHPEYPSQFLTFCIFTLPSQWFWTENPGTDYPRLADNPCFAVEALAGKPLLEEEGKLSHRGGSAAADVSQLPLLFDKNS